MPGTAVQYRVNPSDRAEGFDVAINWRDGGLTEWTTKEEHHESEDANQ
jgi:hypothetical protein